MPLAPSEPGDGLLVALEHLGVHPVQLHPDIMGDAAMGQRLGQRLIAVEQVGVLADDGDGDLALRLGHRMDDAFPAAHVGLAIGREAEMPQHFLVHALGMVLQRHAVDRTGIKRRDDAFRADIAEQRDLAALVLRDRPVAAAEQDLRLDAEPEQFLDRMLGRLGLQLPGRADIGDQREVHEEAALRPHLVRQLPQGLEEGQRLDVADGAADFDQDEVVAVGLGLDDFLDLVGDVGNDLDGAAEVVAAPFGGDDVGVDPPGRPIVRLGGVDAGEALVVTEV